METETKPDEFEVISVYTRAQALEDGVLVDLSYLAREAGFRWPLAVTRAVWGLVEPCADLKQEGRTGARFDSRLTSSPSPASRRARSHYAPSADPATTASPSLPS